MCCMFTIYHRVLNWHEGTRRERWLVNTSQKLMVVHKGVGGSDKRRTLLIPSLSPAAAMVVLVQPDLWADWSVMTTPPLWFQRLPCTVSFSSPWSPSSASSKFNVWAWRCFLNAPVLYQKGDKYDNDSEDIRDMTEHTKQTKVWQWLPDLSV